MSKPVELDDLRDRVAEYGTAVFVVTVNDDGSAHVVSAALRFDGDQLVVPAGRRTRANVDRSAQVTLLWPPALDPAYSMIVDANATADADAETISLAPHSAVLHRVADAAGDGPTCIPVTP